jgi:hypothetical protein
MRVTLFYLHNTRVAFTTLSSILQTPTCACKLTSFMLSAGLPLLYVAMVNSAST